MQLPSNQGLRLASLSALTLVLVAYFLGFLRNFSYLPGTDAYYYALQAQSLLATGALKVPDHDAFHYLVAGIARLGPSIESSFRIMLTVVFAFYQLGMLMFILRLRVRTQAIASLLWVLSSPIIAFHTIEFPNLSLGLAAVPLWFWLAMKPVRSWIFCLAALLLAAALLHPAAAALAMLFAATVTLRTGQPPKDPKRQKRTLGFCMLAGGAVLLIVAAYSGMTLRILSMRPGLPGLLGLISIADVPNEMRLTVLSCWLLLALLLITCWKRCSREWKFLAALTLALPLWPDRVAGLAGLGGRLSALLALVALPLMMVLLDEVLRESAEPRISLAVPQPAWTRNLIALGLVIAVAFLPLRLRAYSRLLTPGDYGAYEKVVAAMRDTKVPMLIAHRGLDFFYTYRLRRDAFHFDPEASWNRAEIWRVAARITPEEVAYYSPPSCPWGETAKPIRGTDYILVREDCWEGLRATITRNNNPDLYTEVWDNMENPSQGRPAFLRARHRDLIPGRFSADR